MGLNIVVGITADLLEDDEEGAQYYAAQFATLSRHLTAAGLQPHVEPPDAEELSYEMFGYSGLHYLRRFAAHIHYNGTPPSGREFYSCLRLYHAASHSLATGAAIVFS